MFLAFMSQPAASKAFSTTSKKPYHLQPSTVLCSKMLTWTSSFKKNQLNQSTLEIVRTSRILLPRIEKIFHHHFNFNGPTGPPPPPPHPTLLCYIIHQIGNHLFIGCRQCWPTSFHPFYIKFRTCFSIWHPIFNSCTCCAFLYITGL